MQGAEESGFDAGMLSSRTGESHEERENMDSQADGKSVEWFFSLGSR